MEKGQKENKIQIYMFSPTLIVNVRKYWKNIIELAIYIIILRSYL